MIFINFTIREIVLDTEPGAVLNSVVEEAANFAVEYKCTVRFYHNATQYLADTLGIVTIKGK